MAIFPIITILLIAMIIARIFFNGTKKNDLKNIKRKRKISKKISIIIPIYFVILLVPTIWVQTISNNTIDDFKKVSKEEYRESSIGKGFVDYTKVKSDKSIELAESKRYAIENSELLIDGEIKDIIDICVMENSELKNEMVITPFRKKNFIESNGEIFDISVILPFDSYEVNGNNVKVKNEKLSTKIFTFNTDFDIEKGIEQFRGILIEVPKGTKVNDDVCVIKLISEE